MFFNDLFYQGRRETRLPNFDLKKLAFYDTRFACRGRRVRVSRNPGFASWAYIWSFFDLAMPLGAASFYSDVIFPAEPSISIDAYLCRGAYLRRVSRRRLAGGLY